MSKKNTITVKQIYSAQRRPKVQQQCLHALGLRRISQTNTLEDNDIVRGLINKISHLIEVVEASESK
ncbi:MAG: 50S ribosomal protein L30 [Rickettsiales bacterium]|nr:50S ribosomal protein L30 [Rickettsiales bacterium]|tara:strand:- start:8616 stop:8816 length:201 start_codon:yes stop_codon:yes gene_type:complete